MIRMGLLNRLSTPRNSFQAAERQPLVIVGLGNVGKQYERTRHNAGFMALDAAAAKWDLAEFKATSKLRAAVLQGQINGQTVYLAKPDTLMNNSGRAVRQLLDYYKVPLSRLLVVTDDIDLPFGTIRTRLSGSSGGHNGLNSLIDHLKSDQFARIRIGAANELRGTAEASDIVLGRFNRNEEAHLPQVLAETNYLIEAFVNGEFADETIKTFLN